jgi:hypothetical protein
VVVLEGAAALHFTMSGSKIMDNTIFCPTLEVICFEFESKRLIFLVVRASFLGISYLTHAAFLTSSLNFEFASVCQITWKSVSRSEYLFTYLAQHVRKQHFGFCVAQYSLGWIMSDL